MPTYFKPLRRKIGVLTLVIACVFMSLWLRSFVVADVFRKTIGTRFAVGEAAGQYGIVQYSCVSANGILYCNREANLFRDDEFGKATFESILQMAPPNTTWTRHQGASRNKDALLGMSYPVLKRGFSGFGIHWNKFRRSFQMEMLKVEYWSIVVPLTLLSSWLLLSKPRKREKSVATPT